MRNTTNLILALVLTLFVAYAQELENDFTKYVNPFIGTGGNGHTYPGPTTPFGKVQLSPDNKSFSSQWEYCSGYKYSDSIIVGFSHTHLSGTGVSDLGDVLVTPFVGKNLFNTVDNASYSSSFSHKNEKASLGYYEVFLNKPKVKVALTTSHSVGFHQYAFPKTDSAVVVVDVNHKIYFGKTVDSYLKVIDDSTVIGQKNSLDGWANIRHVFFAIRFQKKFYQTLFSKKEGNSSINTFGLKYIKSNEPKGAFYFKTNENEKIQFKVAISTISTENAIENLNEIESWDFEKALSNNKSIWNNHLSKIQIVGTPKQKEIFYTSLYHTLLSPNQLAEKGEFYGPDYSKHQSKNGEFYSTFSLWDTYRAVHPLYTILFPNKVKNMVQSMMYNYKYNHYLPMWTLWGIENNCMIANHSIPVITDAYLKGLLSKEEGKEAYQAMLYSSIVEHPVSPWNSYIKHGYYPSNNWENVSKTLESCYNDWCVLQMAKEFGTKDEILNFEKRANNYKNIFHPKYLLMWPKQEDGQWKQNYSPKEILDGWRDVTEGNSWQYTWSVQHDPKGLISLFGNENNFIKMLDSTFSDKNKPTIEVADVSGFIGEYAHGNEPSHHVSYLYNYVNQPKKTQKFVKKIIESQYDNTPEGICGNEDCGQMSAWYIFNLLGMYPLNPANGKYDLSAPQIPLAKINLENGKVFTIKTIGLSDKNCFVKSVTLNGVVLKNNFITHQQIMNGGILTFNMTNK